ncbi:phage tail protein [Nocardioides panacisoli]|uniref:Tail fiber protein n=1 Tax=Nocardioides panacisoli TaxID=627624 RepID=A0ABP7IZ52_9ACTN
MAQPYTGEIRMFGGNFAPVGWLMCNGQLLPISEYEVLFQLIGTTYGGDGQETFALPDLRGRLPVHQGTGSDGTTYVIGEAAGVESVTLTTNQIPVHTHALTANDSQPGNAVTPGGNLPAMSLNVVPFIQDATSGSFNAAAIGPAGGSQPHTNLQPYLCVNFIIAYDGLFPSPT